MNKFENILQQALSLNDINLAPSACDSLCRYLALLENWNRVFNLTQIVTPKEMVYLHLIDSLKAAPFLQGTHMLDVGAGGGLPGIPLAIANPEQQWTLLDKNSKKTRFLIQVVAELQLRNVVVVHERVENFSPQQKFTSIISRAFGSLSYFAKTCEHLLASYGILIAMKGKYPAQEVAELPSAFRVKENARLEIKGIAVERHIVCLTQVT